MLNDFSSEISSSSKISYESFTDYLGSCAELLKNSVAVILDLLFVAFFFAFLFAFFFSFDINYSSNVSSFAASDNSFSAYLLFLCFYFFLECMFFFKGRSEKIILLTSRLFFNPPVIYSDFSSTGSVKLIFWLVLRVILIKLSKF
jgi:hypothetical protein